MPRLSKQRRYGYRRGKTWAVEPRFEKAEPFHHGLAAVRIDGLWGYIDYEGRVVIEPRFERAPPPFRDRHFAGLGPGLDREGREVFKQRRQGSEGLFPFNEGGIQAWDGRWGFRDSDTGEVVIPAQFGGVHPFWGDYAAAMTWIEGTGGRWGLIDRAGSWVLEPTYTVCNGCDGRGGLFSIKEDDVWLTGAVHPVDGTTEPFEKRNLAPDRSRLDPVWPPSKPRTPEDEALVVDSATVEVEASPPQHPFRFYGYRILDGTELDYRIHFAPAVDMAAAAEALADMPGLEPTPYSLIVETEDYFARVILDHDEDCMVTDLEDWLVEHFLAIHERFAILEVLHLFIREADSPWQTWSSETQWPPDAGPMFGATPLGLTLPA